MLIELSKAQKSHLLELAGARASAEVAADCEPFSYQLVVGVCGSVGHPRIGAS